MNPSQETQESGPLHNNRQQLVDISLIIGWLAVAFSFLAAIAKLNVIDLDVFHEMALARQALEIGYLPTTDDFAFTETNAYVVHHEWGTGFILYFVNQIAGLQGLLWLKYVLSFGILFGCWRINRAPTSVWILLSIAVIPIGYLGYTTVRAQLLTLVCLVLLLSFLRVDQLGQRWWCVPWLIVYSLWVNLHGGFLVGAGMFGIYVILTLVKSTFKGDALRASQQPPGASATDRMQLLKNGIRSNLHLLGVLGAMAILTLANPYGWKYVPYLWHAVQMDRPNIAEWQSLDFSDVPFTAVFVLTLAIPFADGRRAVSRFPIELALVLVTAYLGMKHVRHLSLYAVTWWCLVPTIVADCWLGEQIEQTWQRRRTFFGILGSLLIAASLYVACQDQFWKLRIPQHASQEIEGVPIYPVGAVDHLKRVGFQGKLVVPFDAGSYCMWYLYPDVKISLDSRYEVAYPPGSLERSLRLYHADDDWRNILRAYEADAILSRSNAPLTKAMLELEQDRWKRAYVDDAYALFRRSPATGEDRSR